VYYVHPTRRVTTDIDMREDKMLDAVVAFLEHHSGPVVPLGLELWIREGEQIKKGFPPRMFWVDHGRRTVVLHQERQNRHGGRIENAEEDGKGLICNERRWSDVFCF